MDVDKRTTCLRVGYDVLLEVGVDPETGEIVDVTVYPDDFNASDEAHVYDPEDGYLDRDDPRYEWAAARAWKVIPTAWRGVVSIPFIVDESR